MQFSGVRPGIECLAAVVELPGGNAPAGGDSGPAEVDSTTEAQVDGRPTTPDGHSPLAVGQFADFVASSTGSITGSVPVAGQEQFLLLLTSLDPRPLKVHSYQTCVPDASETPGTQPLPDQPGSGRERFCGFDARLRALLASVDTPLVAPKKYRFSYLPPNVGDTRTFKVQGMQITAEALYVDETAAFWIDRTTTPLATIDAAILQQVADSRCLLTYTPDPVQLFTGRAPGAALRRTESL